MGGEQPSPAHPDERPEDVPTELRGAATTGEKKLNLKLSGDLQSRMKVLSGILSLNYSETLDWLLNLEGHEELDRMRGAFVRRVEKQ